jgi:hypothetical protein
MQPSHPPIKPTPPSPPLPPPPPGVPLPLQRENSGALPPFWEARTLGGAAMYTNSLTNHSTQQRPAPIRWAHMLV